MPIWLAKVKDKDSILLWQKCGKRGILTHRWREHEWCRHLRTVWPDSVESSVRISKSSANPRLVIQPGEILTQGYTRKYTKGVHCILIMLTKLQHSFTWEPGEPYLVGELGNILQPSEEMSQIYMQQHGQTSKTMLSKKSKSQKENSKPFL